MKQAWVRWLLPLGILVLWQIAVDSGRWSSYVLPSPMDVIVSGWQLLRDGTLLIHIGVSLGRVAVGFLLAAVTAVPLAIVIGLWEPAGLSNFFGMYRRWHCYRSLFYGWGSGKPLKRPLYFWLRSIPFF